MEITIRKEGSGYVASCGEGEKFIKELPQELTEMLNDDEMEMDERDVAREDMRIKKLAEDLEGKVEKKGPTYKEMPEDMEEEESEEPMKKKGLFGRK